MRNELFFPSLIRQDLIRYHNRDGVFYADYKSNYEMVSQDCLKRCVYCDATEKECGGDRFSLDHFRPRKVFAAKFDGSLLVHPYNLYLSCQKCNVLKSSDWHGDVDKIDGVCFINKIGYIDRFLHAASDYLTVNNYGEIVSVGSVGPLDYMIKKLHLNRPNRVFLRRKRIIHEKIQILLKKFDDASNTLMKQYEKGDITSEQALLKINEIRSLQRAICEF